MDGHIDENEGADGQTPENSDESAPYRLVQMLINEIMADPNPRELVNSNIARLTAEVASLSSQSQVNGVVDQGSNTAVWASRRTPVSVERRRTRRIPSNEVSSESEAESDATPVPPPWRGPPPATTMTATGRSSLWRQIRLLPSSALSMAMPMVPHPPPIAEEEGYQSWRQLRQLGHNVRRFNLESRLNQRFPSTLVNVIGPTASRSLFQSLNPPEQPERIAMGAYSFQPTAKFEHGLTPRPAKPGTKGLARCHEKAAAAQFISNLVGMTSSASEEPQFLPGLGGADIFNRFWTETSTVEGEENPPPAPPTWLGVVGHVFNHQQREEGADSENIDTAAEYLRWDAETRVSNHLRDVWQDLTRPDNWPMRSLSTTGSQIGPRFTSTGVGTGDEDWGEDSSSSDERMPELVSNEEAEAALRSQSSATVQQSPSRGANRFMGETLSHEAVAAMFQLEMPPTPSLIGAGDMGDAQFPVSLGGAGWDYGIGRGPSVFPPVEREGINLHRGYVQEEESESEEEGSSVFARVPEADSTPSPLFRGLVEETEDGGGGGGYCDDARFGSGACYGAIDSRNGESAQSSSRLSRSRDQEPGWSSDHQYARRP